MQHLKLRLALLCFSLFSTLFSLNAWAQAPEKFNYQAVVRNASGEIIASSSVSMRIAILSGSSTGTEVFSEEHALTTNDFGLVNFQIGAGSSQTGSIASIDWGANSYFVAVELDATGGTNYSAMGTAQLLSVPYALYAKSASVDNVDDADADATNELQTLTLSGDTLAISNGNFVVMAIPANNDNDSTNELQVLSMSNDSIFLSNGGFVVLPAVPVNNDNDSTNEIQVLSIGNDTIYLSNGGFVVLPAVPVNNDNDSTNEIQSLTMGNDTIYLSDGGSVVLPMNYDNDSTNEIQSLTIGNDTIYLSDGGSVVLPMNYDNDSTNEIQSLTMSNDTIYLSDGGSVVLPMNYDNDSTNEFQTITYVNDTLMLDNNGGSVEIRQSKWMNANDGIFYDAGSVGIGAAADTNSSLDLSGSDKPMILPSMTLLEIINLPNPVDGMFVFCTTVKCPYYYADSAWHSNCNAGQNSAGGLLAGGSTMGGVSAGGASSHDYGQDIAMDSDGNTYVTGYYQGTSTFGATTLTSAGSIDIFVMKVDTTDSIIWAKSFGGSSYDYGRSIAVDGSGNVYVTGTYYSSGTFGSTTLSGTYDEVFLVKMSASTGAVVWAIDGGGSSSDYGTGVAVDGSGNVYICGYYYGTATYGSYSQTSYGGNDLFVAKCNSSGTWQWMTDAGGSYTEYAQDIAVDANGNAFITGTLSGQSYPSYFGSITVTPYKYYYYYSAFVAKINTSGTWQWAKSVSSDYYSYDYAYGIDVDDDGDAYFVGFCQNNSLSFGSVSASSGGSYTPFIIKANGSNGNGVWAKEIKAASNTNHYVQPQSIAATSDGFLFVAGFTQYGVKIDEISAAGSSSGYYQPFMILADQDGNGVGATTAQTTNYEYCYGVDAIDVSHAAATGYFSGASITFGNTTVTNSSSSGYYDVFVWSFNLNN